MEKFNYLNSLLERSARDAWLDSLLQQLTIDTLTKRFHCKQLIANKHMDALMQVDAVTSSHNVKGLRQLFDCLSCHLRSLKSLGVETGSYGGSPCPVLLNKIPQEFQLIISRKVTETDWSLDKLMELIEEELIVRERVGMSQGRSHVH